MSIKRIFTCVLATSSSVFAVTIPKLEQNVGLLARQASSTTKAATSTAVADPSCTNGPFTRACWGNGFSIATDYDVDWPVTGRTVSVSFARNILSAQAAHLFKILE